MFGARCGFRGGMRSCCGSDVGWRCHGTSGRKRRRRGDERNCYLGCDPRGRSLHDGGQCRRLGRSAARFGSLEEKIGFTSEDDGLAILQDPKALPGDVAGRSVAFDRVVTIGGIVGQVGMRALRHEPCAVFVNQNDVPEQIQQLRL